MPTRVGRTAENELKWGQETGDPARQVGRTASWPPASGASELRRMIAPGGEGNARLPAGLYKLPGLKLMTTYAQVAIIGDITLFVTSSSWSATSGAIPASWRSRHYEYEGGASHGRGQAARPAQPIQQTAADLIFIKEQPFCLR